jgi:hypothetical protein
VGYADGILYHPRCHDQKVWIMDGVGKNSSTDTHHPHPFSFCVHGRDTPDVSLKIF